MRGFPSPDVTDGTRLGQGAGRSDEAYGGQPIESVASGVWPWRETALLRSLLEESISQTGGDNYCPVGGSTFCMARDD